MKRTNNLIIGNLSEHIIFDQVQFGVQNYKILDNVKLDKIASKINHILVLPGIFFKNNLIMNTNFRMVFIIYILLLTSFPGYKNYI